MCSICISLFLFFALMHELHPYLLCVVRSSTLCVHWNEKRNETLSPLGTISVPLIIFQVLNCCVKYWEHILRGYQAGLEWNPVYVCVS
jgi:hypothetical protein